MINVLSIHDGCWGCILAYFLSPHERSRSRFLCWSDKNGKLHFLFITVKTVFADNLATLERQISSELVQRQMVLEMFIAFPWALTKYLPEHIYEFGAQNYLPRYLWKGHWQPYCRLPSKSPKLFREVKLIGNILRRVWIIKTYIKFVGGYCPRKG